MSKLAGDVLLPMLAHVAMAGRKMMNSKEFNEIAAGVQSMAATVAIIAGGIWTYYTFSALGTSAKAKAEIAELEQNAAETPGFSISPDWKTSNAPVEDERHFAAAKHYNVYLSVVVKNEGKRPLEFENLNALLLRRSNSGGIDKAWAPVLIPAQVTEPNGDTWDMPLRVLTVGQARHIAFLTPPVPSGSYFVEIRAIFRRQSEKHDQPGIEAVEQYLFEAPSGPATATSGGAHD